LQTTSFKNQTSLIIIFMITVQKNVKYPYRCQSRIVNPDAYWYVQMYYNEDGL